jgi:hypothetical protein
MASNAAPKKKRKPPAATQELLIHLHIPAFDSEQTLELNTHIPSFRDTKAHHGCYKYAQHLHNGTFSTQWPLPPTPSALIEQLNGNKQVATAKFAQLRMMACTLPRNSYTDMMLTYIHVETLLVVD